MIKRLTLLSLLLGASAPAWTGAARAASDGAALFNANCAVCHQAGGVGSPGQFPPLKDRIDKIAGTPEGKTYIADVVLNGLNGPIQAGGSPYVGFMPSLKALSDDDLAAILTYLSALGQTKPAPVFAAADIKTARATPKKAKEVLAERKALDAAHPLP